VALVLSDSLGLLALLTELCGYRIKAKQGFQILGRKGSAQKARRRYRS
jgi:hypothetical protein